MVHTLRIIGFANKAGELSTGLDWWLIAVVVFIIIIKIYISTTATTITDITAATALTITTTTTNFIHYFWICDWIHYNSFCLTLFHWRSTSDVLS